MKQLEFYKPLVADGPRRIAAASEARYHELWCEHALVHADDLLAMAVTGGLAADRLAWVFAAGYQAACRRAFPSAQLHTWVAFAASEDRKGDPPLPGVTIDDASQSISGHKTWVAGARCMEQLAITVGTGADARYLLLDRTATGLRIDRGRPRRFLADLSQGRAHFDATPLAEATPLDPGAVRHFRLLEPLYIYAAFCGFVLGATTERDLVACSHDCLDAIEPALRSIGDGAALDRFNLHKADARAQDLLVRLSGNRLDAAGDWDSDQRLIAMYSKGMRRD